MKKFFLLIPVFSVFLVSVYGQTEVATGTGFFISGDGIVITCAHVIEDGSKIVVRTGGKEYTAQVLAKNAANDLAVLKINYKNPYHFKIANFNSVNLGDKVYVLGFPLSSLLGADIRLTDGIVSAKSGINSDQTYFQISAPVQPGNSGGPVLSGGFEVMGVAAAKLNDMSTLAVSGSIPQNINFGIKSGFISQVLNSGSINSRSVNTRPGNGNVKTMNDAVSATVQIVCYETIAQSGSSIKIVNKTGYTVYYVYVSPASSDSWGSDRLGAGILEDGRSTTVSSLPLNTATLYDIRLVDEDNDTYTKSNVRLSPNQSVEFSFDDIDNNGSASNVSSGNAPAVTIVNDTGYMVYYVYISPSSSKRWGEDMLDDEVLPYGRSFTVRLPSSGGRYDIRLEDSDGDTYTKTDILITRGRTIKFTIDDLD